MIKMIKPFFANNYGKWLGFSRNGLLSKQYHSYVGGNRSFD